MEAQEREVTGWVGWVVFAAVILIMVGVFDIISGLIAIFDDKWLAGTPGGLFVWDSTAWGWITLILGIVILFAAFAILKGQVWGRTVAVILAALNAINQLSTMRAYPVWSLIVILLDVFVIYALTVHGGELKQQF